MFSWQNVLFYFLRKVQFIVFTLNSTLVLKFSFAFAFLAILVELMNIAQEFLLHRVVGKLLFQVLFFIPCYLYHSFLYIYIETAVLWDKSSAFCFTSYFYSKLLSTTAISFVMNIYCNVLYPFSLIGSLFFLISVIYLFIFLKPLRSVE